MKKNVFIVSPWYTLRVLPWYFFLFEPEVKAMDNLLFHTEHLDLYSAFSRVGSCYSQKGKLSDTKDKFVIIEQTL